MDVKRQVGLAFSAKLAFGFLGLVTALWGLPAKAQNFSVVQSTPAGAIQSISSGAPGVPTVIKNPQSRTAFPGTSAAFSVTASGSPPLQYQWYLNTTSIPKATNDSLVIPSAAFGDFGAYYVIIANAYGSATSAVAQLQMDADGDGLADSWEIANFGSITNQNAMMDFDGDGNSNLQEFLDGTSPTNKSSLLPRLVIRSIGGDVLLSPNNDHYNLGDTVTLTAVPYPGLTFLCWGGDVSGANPGTNLVMNGDKFVQATFGLPLNEVLGVTNLFTTGGDGGWFGQTDDSQDGVSAARTAPIIKHTTTASASWMQTSVTLAKDGTVSFWWHSDAADNNNVEFLIDNALIFNATRQLFNATPWVFHTSYLAAGTHTLKWTYNHGADGSSLAAGYSVVPQDSAFVDQLVITEYADPNLDTDGDGLPDLWEYKYFDTLAYGASDDNDGDGVNNLQEFLDGTLPNIDTSVKPRLAYVIEGSGAASASPNLPKYSYSQTVSNTATPDAGWRFVAWRGPFLSQTVMTTKTNNPFALQLLWSESVLAIFGRPLAEVTDTPTLIWTNGGELGWYGQTNISLDGVSAARSGPLSPTGESWMETTVQGPGSLSFWWKVDSTTNTDLLTFLLNSVTQPGGISGVVDWRQQSIYLGAGPQTLRWRFLRNRGNDTNRLAAAWVDQVQFSTGTTVPQFVAQPADQTVLQISNAAVQVFARGTPPITYQLYHGATPYGQPTTATTLFITNPPPALAGTWTVQASNAGGVTTSAPFILTVVPAPPLNDNFVNRFALGPAPVVGYNFAATKEPGEPNHAGQTGGASVWWSWTAPQAGRFRAVAQGTNVSDVLLAGVYSGTSVGALTAVGATSYNTTNDPAGNSIQIADDTFDAGAGATYAIAVDTSFATGLWFDLWVQYLPPPPNDLFANRTPLTGASASGSSQLRTATAEPGEPAHAGLPATNSVWWTWTAPQTGAVAVNAWGNLFYPRVAVYTGTALTSLHQVTGGFGGGTNGATLVNFNATAGTAYQIAVDSFFGSVGDIQINVALTVPSLASSGVDSTGNFNFSVEGPVGAGFVIEASDNLKTWSAIYNGVIPASGHFDFQAAIPPGVRARYYRVRLS